MLKDIIAFLRGGTSKFFVPEKLVLEAVMQELPQEEALILEEQIKSIFLVQRHNPGKLIAAYYPKKSQVPSLPYHGYEYCLAKVKYEVVGKTKTTDVVLHNGKLMTFERNVPLKNEQIFVKEVKLHPSSYEPIALEIDASEHGGT
ncbi:hypothetical protein tinsulaeT_00300 [Thalassotalea insulae]|uniref:WYL domain-containing protein n=1 Tax=Thalassotalea insulae TaxID=2056778 RepID=A0ABQ6GQI1_9GAMM|nr:hypothetical protein [Thalassotalea insulae]GLX76690.1 hypothetical protein tinsulaeT_00300 [Thalassotalea insulae]